MSQSATSRRADPAQGYPRPLLQRDGWISLNGCWEFALDPAHEWATPNDVHWGKRNILVPFAPETAASGIEHTGYYKACWYRRSFSVPALPPGWRLLLHFGAVDYRATVWIDDTRAGCHEGGYTPFWFDITDLVRGKSELTLAVCAEDDPHDLAQPRGKQDWQLQPHSIWYPRTTGIWQTVWLEAVPATSIESVRWSSNLERWELSVEARLRGAVQQPLRLAVRLTIGDRVLADDVYSVSGSELERRIALSDPGIDDSRNELLWNPAAPRTIAAELSLLNADGQRLDTVRSYTALRSVSVQGDRILINGRPFPLRMVLDQGYWVGTGITPPDDDAIRKDVELAKAMGFNGVRKHQKIEDPRYLYWCDTLGLLVWEEMPSAYRFTRKSIERVLREWVQVIERDISHPCIIAWVPLNESWGVPNLPDNQAERDYVRALYHVTKTLDRARPVVGNDGWESVATDIIGIHDYDHDPARIRRRYHAEEALPRLFKRERPGGRLLLLEPHDADHPIVISEFGGIGLGPKSTTWGYTRCETPEQLQQAYAELLGAIHALGTVAGFCYTQFADTYQEANGLLYANRVPKFPLEEIAAATTGARR